METDTSNHKNGPLAFRLDMKRPTIEYRFEAVLQANKRCGREYAPLPPGRIRNTSKTQPRYLRARRSLNIATRGTLHVVGSPVCPERGGEFADPRLKDLRAPRKRGFSDFLQNAFLTRVHRRRGEETHLRA